jgi:hypothetical protein
MTARRRLTAADAVPPGVARSSEDSLARVPGGHGFRPPRTAFRRPPGLQRARRPVSRSRRAALLGLPLPYRDRSPGPRAVSPTRRRLVRRRLLSWASATLRHTLGAADPFVAAVPPATRAASGVWLPPSRRSLPSLPARIVPERPWVSPFKAFPSTAMGTPLGAPALLALPASPTASLPGERATGDPAVFRASFPRRVRADTGARKGPGRRCLPGVHPSRASARPTRRTP